MVSDNEKFSSTEFAMEKSTAFLRNLRNCIFIVLISVSFQVESSFLHHQHPLASFFAHQQQSYFQSGGGGSEFFGFGGFSPHQHIYPSAPQEPLSPFPINNHWDSSSWWKPQSNELLPSLQSWDTSYNVPCGTYTIHPLVIANVRYSSYQHNAHQFSPSGQPSSGSAAIGSVSVTGSASASASQSINNHLAQKESRSLLSPSHSQFHPFGHFHQAPLTTCTWNFKAFKGSCKLKFTCQTFQLPALFRCEENYLEIRGGVLGENKTFCGSRRPRGEYDITSDAMQLNFHSQSSASLPSVFDCSVRCSLELYQSDTGANLTYTDSQSTPVVIKNLTIPIMDKIVTNALTPPKEPQYSRNDLRYLNCKCGVRNDTLPLLSRIVGGTETSVNEFPWNAALISTTDSILRPFCGATLISDRWLITAAHCMVQGRNGRENPENNTTSANLGKKLKPNVEVLLNPHNISTSFNYHNKIIRAKINKVLIHSRYTPETFDYDIALLRLAKPIIKREEEGRAKESEEPLPKFSDWTLMNNAIIESQLKKKIPSREGYSRLENSWAKISRQDNEDFNPTNNHFVPICLPKIKERSFQDNQAVVTGFGLLREGGPPSETLMQTQVQIFNHSLCTQLYEKENLTITQQMLCAGRLHGQMDSCVGDSGGSLLVHEENGQNTLAGIVSWGRGCARPNLPGVYTNVAKFVDWIYSNIDNADSYWCTH